jgi:hypothetical protein
LIDVATHTRTYLLRRWNGKTNKSYYDALVGRERFAKWYWQSTVEATVGLHAPSKGWFTASLIIAVIAVIGALSPIPYLTAHGIWVALLAYVVLVIGNLAQSSSDTDRSAPSGRGVIH